MAALCSPQARSLAIPLRENDLWAPPPLGFLAEPSLSTSLPPGWFCRIMEQRHAQGIPLLEKFRVFLTPVALDLVYLATSPFADCRDLL